MATQADFTAREWELFGNAPLAAGAAVALAEPGGATSETQALVAGWREAGALFPEIELIQAIARDLDPEAREMRERESGQPRPAPSAPASILDEAIDLCGAAISLLKRKASPQEVDAYKQFVLHIVRKVATAERAGGFLGLGGVRLTRDERIALSEIEAALDYSPLD